MATKRELASVLRMLPSMTWKRVAILAVVAFAGCGVGIEEAQAQTPGTVGTQADAISKPADPPPEFRPRTAGDPSTALPQDPVPDFEEKKGPRKLHLVPSEVVR
ncbi:MAG: hypothetical protein K1X89_05595 [Myxococcaceae bacterium]|nr:hypothetical protein [Myxococcaceae bacterium]